MHLLKKIINIVIDVIIILMLVFSALVAGLALASKSDGIPNLFGYATLSVKSDSMVPEFSSGDLIISKITDENTEIQVGDVITFPITINGLETLNSHRVVKIDDLDGVPVYTTKGDNNTIEDADLVVGPDALAVYTGTCLVGWGTAYDFLTSQTGFFIVVLLPLILFFIYEAIRVVRNLIAYNKEKAYNEALKDNAGGLSEEEMKLAVENYLSQQKLQTEELAPQETETQAETETNAETDAKGSSDTEE